MNWIILDSDWEAEFCRIAEAHPKVRAYVKNHNLGLEVPYRSGSESRTYIPDFIAQVDDGRGEDDPLHLIVEIKGYRNEDAKAKKITMETYWVPGVNNLRQYGRWAFAEFTDIFDMEVGFSDLISQVVTQQQTSGHPSHEGLDFEEPIAAAPQESTDLVRRIESSRGIE